MARFGEEPSPNTRDTAKEAAIFGDVNIVRREVVMWDPQLDRREFRLNKGESHMLRGHFTRYIGIIAGLCITTWVVPLHAQKECYAPDARAQERAFSRAVITEGGTAIWLGGQTSQATDFDTQVREIFASLDATLQANGGSLRDLVTMTVYIIDVRLGDRFVELRREIFMECFPASTLITVSGFARPVYMLEVQGIAVIGSD